MCDSLQSYQITLFYFGKNYVRFKAVIFIAISDHEDLWKQK